VRRRTIANTSVLSHLRIRGSRTPEPRSTTSSGTCDDQLFQAAANDILFIDRHTWIRPKERPYEYLEISRVSEGVGDVHDVFTHRLPSDGSHNSDSGMSSTSWKHSSFNSQYHVVAAINYSGMPSSALVRFVPCLRKNLHAEPGSFGLSDPRCALSDLDAHCQI